MKDRPTAIFAANDYMALGAIYTIQDSGLKVPDDIAVVGCDDRDIASFSKPTITTICPPSYEMGKIAARLIIDRLEKQVEITDPIKIQGKLIIRESCGAGQKESSLELHASHTIPPDSLIQQWRGKTPKD